jgi:hypothetical protein
VVPVASGSEVNILIKVEIPASAVSGEVDTAKVVVTSSGDDNVSDMATLITRSYIPIPWYDDFPSTTLSNKWSYNHNAEINSEGINEPSPPYSLSLISPGEVRSEIFDLTKWHDLVLSYYYVKPFDFPENELYDEIFDLWVDYYNSSGSWVSLNQHVAMGKSMSSYDSVGIYLPPDAYHSDFSFRFHLYVEMPRDPFIWFVDNVRLAVVPPPEITVSPDYIAASLNMGDSTTQVLSIGNVGKGNLHFNISIKNDTTNTNSRIERAIASIIERSGILSHEIRINSFDLESKQTIEIVYTHPEEVANVKYLSNLSKSSSGTSVAIVAAVGSGGAIHPHYIDVRDKLLNTGKFSSITIINAGVITPTTKELQAFDAVLVWPDFPFFDNSGLGNNMADYVDSSGGVVLAIYETVDFNSWHLGGRWESEKYFVIERISNKYDHAILGTIAVPDHPIMKGVTSFDGGDYNIRPSGTTHTYGSTLIASWSDGIPLVAVKEINGVKRVDLGLYPPSADASSYGWLSSTDGALLMANSLEWVSSTNWLFCDYTSGVVPTQSIVMILLIQL